MIVLFAVVWSALLLLTFSQSPELAFNGDGEGYHLGAVHILTDGSYTYGGRYYTEREPGQSMFLALLYLIGGIGNLPFVFFGQALLYLLCVLFFHAELRSIVSKRVVRISFVLHLFLPPVWHTLFSLNREALALSLCLLVAGLFLRLVEQPSWRIASAMGFTLGALILTYITFLLLPLFFLFLFWVHRVSLKYFLPFLGMTALIVALWGARNYADVGRPCITGCYRGEVQWSVRGMQVENVRGLEHLRCLWSEYISRDWTGRSPYCHFNAVQHLLWPDGLTYTDRDYERGREGRARILQNFPNYLWYSLLDVIELHLPYVNGWGFWYNLSAAAAMVILYVGCLGSLPTLLRRRDLLLFLVLIGYNTGLFSLTDAIPRYLLPVMFAYVVLAAVGYDRMLSFLRLWRM